MGECCGELWCAALAATMTAITTTPVLEKVLTVTASSTGTKHTHTHARHTRRRAAGHTATCAQGGVLNTWPLAPTHPHGNAGGDMRAWWAFKAQAALRAGEGSAQQHQQRQRQQQSTRGFALRTHADDRRENGTIGGKHGHMAAASHEREGGDTARRQEWRLGVPALPP